jgi:hypothetical protein
MFKKFHILEVRYATLNTKPHINAILNKGIQTKMVKDGLDKGQQVENGNYFMSGDLEL